ncbi:MAG: FtsQ-type POTRA domain-containing protein [Lachnospiraceae bacterium]|nr:FtsQ-type POTRA domain-containing protein [Lachnospiraceae bacterium]
MDKTKLKKILIRMIIIMIILIAVCAAILVIREKCNVSIVDIEGNEHYSTAEIRDLVMDGPYGTNSVYLYLKYKNKTVKDIPFIEKMNVKIISPNHIRIDVYEKAVAGYIEYLGHYIYFDREGIAVESSTETTPGIPFVTGLDFDHVVLHEKLPAVDETIFAKILSITQLLTKYDIPTDRIYFDKDENITLYYGNVRIYIGTDAYIDEKINELSLLLPKLEGYSGVLHMENYKGEGGNFTLQKDEEIQDTVVDFEVETE